MCGLMDNLSASCLQNGEDCESRKGYNYTFMYVCFESGTMNTVTTWQDLISASLTPLNSFSDQ